MKIKKKEKSAFDIIITNAVTLFFMLTFVLMVFFVYCNLTNTAPSIGGYSIFRVLTGSMEPTYPENSYIIIKKTDASKLKEGDVISFYSKDEAIYGQINTHRIQSIEENDGKRIFTTKGDANPVEDDSKVEESDVLGKVVAHISLLDSIGKAIRNPWVYLIIVIIPLATRFIIELKNVAVAVVEMQKDKENEQEYKADRERREESSKEKGKTK